jgi:eukaryotic-like serine/threonine-protein kinase
MTAYRLPPAIVDRAANGLGWMSLISAVTPVALALIEQAFQPEFAAAWRHPILRLTLSGVFLLSVGFIALQRSGWVSKRRLLDLGIVFQVAIAFAGALFEGAAYRNADAVVIGVSGVALWMMLCARLMPNAPLKSALTAILCAAMWPLAYRVDLMIYGYQPMPLRRLMVWILPLLIVSVWMYVLNLRAISLFAQQQNAEDVGTYVLTRQLGRGGMGEVWRARHKTLAREAAVKLIRREVLQAGSRRQEQLLKRRFEREAQVTASLRSPHTVALYDFGQTRCGAFYYAMELIDGIDLQTLVERFGPMEPARVVYILHQVAQSLEEAHRAGMVHRDIKPRNIMLGKLGLDYDFAKVLDFGLVKTLDHEDAERSFATADGATTGTPAYLSPEAALGSPHIDGRSDLYSLGCTAYYLLTGMTVFDAPTATAYALAHVKTPPTPMSARTELPIPAGLEAIVMQLLEKEPADRLSSAHELARRLRALRDVSIWTPEQAEQWWEINLPDLVVPATVAEEEETLTVAAQTAA